MFPDETQRINTSKFILNKYTMGNKYQASFPAVFKFQFI